MKKLGSIILAFSVLFCMLCIPAFSNSDIKLTDEVYPTVIVCGNTFSVYGMVSSSNNISYVKLTVKDSEGNTPIYYRALPGTKTYDIHNVDYLMTFSKLEVGEYTYSIVAGDSTETDVVLLEKTFSVIPSTTLKLTNANYPETITQGDTFSVYGTVTSDYMISEITCAVYSENDTLQFIKTVTPGEKSYSISNVDRYMTFSKLTAGKYTYKITASDAFSKDVVLLSADFRVVNTGGTKLTVSNANYPTSFTEGKTFSVKGTVSSDYNITKVKAGVYKTNGATEFERTAEPGTTSYNISNLDPYMTFSRLRAGSYVYRISASDQMSEDIVLLEKSFKVVSDGASEENPHDVLLPVNRDVIDLSYHNEIISWDKIAASVDGVILRLGYRSTGSKHSIGMDPQFLNYYKEAKAHGLHVGCYFFSDALTVKDAEEEADFVISKLKENNCQLDMPVYFDMETDGQVALSQSACTEIARTFCDRVKNSGYYVGIYCNKFFARDELYASRLSDFTFWIAQYASACSYNGAYGMWQYSETGSVPGIKGNVDLDYCYYDFPSYIVANGLNGYGTVPPVVVEPSYKIKTDEGIKVDEAKGIISLVTVGVDTGEFIKTYIERTSDVSVVFGNTVSNKIATGTTVTIKTDDKVLGSYTISVIADVDGNGKVDSSDALSVLQYAIGKLTLSEIKKISADVNGDGSVNSSDALEVLLIAVKSGV